MEHFLSFLDDNITRLSMEEQKLITSDRKDEANLMRIKQNVYGIAKSLYEVEEKLSFDRAREKVLHKLNGIQKTWEGNYEKAKEHADVERIVVEETKLEALCDILRWIESQG